MFSHTSSSVINVETIPERIMSTPSAPTEEDFPNLPTIGPVVRTESRAEQEQETTKPVLWGSIVAQGQIRQVAVKEISMHMEQMLPQIMAKITEAITQMNLASN